MAYVEKGDRSKPLVIFLHGNPSTSFLWRDVIPSVESCAHVIAPDLPGLGDSEKLDDYSIPNWYTYLEAFVNWVRDGRDVNFVLHDWGSGLGFNYIKNNPDGVLSVCFMEAITGPHTYQEQFADAAPLFYDIRETDTMDKSFLEDNFFINVLFPSNILRFFAKVEERDLENAAEVEPNLL